MSKEAIVVVFMSCFRVVMTTSSLSSTSISQFSDLPRRKGSETETPASTLPPPPLSTSVADSSGQGRPRVKKDHNSMGPPVDLGYLYAVPKSTTGLYSFWSDLIDRDPGNTSPNVSRSFFTSVSLAKESSLSSSTTFMSTRTVLDSVEFKVSEISTSSTANSGFQTKTDHLSKQEDQDQQQQHHHQHHHQHQHHHHNRFPHTIVFQAFEIFLCIFLSCFIMLVVVGNAYVILAVCVFEKMRTLSNGLIASLATADFMVALAVMPISLHRELTKGLWTLGWAICDFWVTADVLCCTASILNIAVIALDRYWLITRNVKYTHSDSCPRRKMCALMLASAWSTALLISCAPLLGWRNGDEKNDPTQCVISQDYAYTLFSTVGAFWLPLGVILVVYSRVFTFARQRVVRRRQKHQGEKVHKCSKNTNGTYADPKSLLTTHNNGIMAVAMAISRKLSVPASYPRRLSKAETSSFIREETRKFSLAPQAETYTTATPFLVDQEPSDEEVTKEATPVKGKRSFFSVTLAASRLLRLHRKRQEQKKERRNYPEASSSFSRDDDEFSDFRSKAETSQDMTSDCYSRNGSIFIEADTYDDSAGDVLGMARNNEGQAADDSSQLDGRCPDVKVRQVCIVPSKRLLLTPTACDRHQHLTRSRSKKRSKKSANAPKHRVDQVHVPVQRPPLESKVKTTTFASPKSKRASSLTVDNSLARQAVKTHEKLRCVNSHPLVCPPSILKNQSKSRANSLRVRDPHKTIVKCSSFPLFRVNQDNLKPNLEDARKTIPRIDLLPKSESFPGCKRKTNISSPISETPKLKPPVITIDIRSRTSTPRTSEIAISVLLPPSLKKFDRKMVRDESGQHLLNPESPDSTEGRRESGGKVRISDSCPLSCVPTDPTFPGVETSTRRSFSEKTCPSHNFRRKFSQRAAAVITSTTSDLIKIRQSRRMRKSARTLGLIIGGFLVCWLPFFCLATITPFCPEACQVPHIVSSLTLWLGYFNSLLNPIIYAIWDDNFRRAFKRLSRCDFK